MSINAEAAWIMGSVSNAEGVVDVGRRESKYSDMIYKLIVESSMGSQGKKEIEVFYSVSFNSSWSLCKTFQSTNAFYSEFRIRRRRVAKVYQHFDVFIACNLEDTSTRIFSSQEQ